jgi:hypothetical protein
LDANVLWAACAEYTEHERGGRHSCMQACIPECRCFSY